MKETIIPDNNILFSLMNPNSAASQIFEHSNLNFIAPKFIKSEFNEHRSECLTKSGLSEKNFKAREEKIISQIKFYDVIEYKKFLKKAIKLISDPDDVPYLALALSTNCPIWSNDPHLKEQTTIGILTTQELIELIEFE